MNLDNLITTINTVHQTFQAKALQSVSVNLTLRNLVIGYYIVEYEQSGSDKAAYGIRLIENLAQKLAHIKGVSVTALKLMRQFYLTYPQISQSLTDQFKIDTKISQSVIDHYTAGLDKNLFVSKYKIMLPSTKDLEKLVKDDLEEMTSVDVNEK